MIIFPAGEVSRFGVKGVKDGDWQHGFIRIANTAQAHNTVEARVGAPIPWQNYHTVSTSPRTLAGQFRRHVYRLARNAPPIFRGVEAIAEPENRRLLEQEVTASELLGCTPDGMQIHLCKMERAPCTMREIGRLRELAFRAVGEGSGLPRDIDRFDQNYLQLVLWDPDNREAALPAGTADPLALRHCHCKRHEDNVQLPLRRASQSCRATGA
ncbi:MAG: lysophospholipid acyltransferase family protein [Halieaceae bacterium]|uniref:hypothetical protein n=1 Tax=Haliea alexandrii TaxID=2448162 RepID=UPI000F0B1C17|nr:hypothetical protein [Haliea alexandrii]MCR9184493.1 lysophospholipid acyltransferase family protein [Halieaceae bacterium]